MITDHRTSLSHDFDWNNIAILDSERSFFKRLISESLHIHSQKQDINSQVDSDLFDSSYLSLVDSVDAKSYHYHVALISLIGLTILILTTESVISVAQQQLYSNGQGPH